MRNNKVRAGRLAWSASLWVLFALTTGCGGGGDEEKNEEPPPPAAHAIGGTLSGLKAASVDFTFGYFPPGGDRFIPEFFTLTSNGPFTLQARVPAGSEYSLNRVNTQSPRQKCGRARSEKVMPDHDVTDFDIVCRDSYTVGGIISGLRAGETVRLDSEPMAPIVLTQNGPFHFDVPFSQGPTADGQLLPGDAYDVTVHPSGGMTSRQCRVRNGKGVITDHDVDSVRVTCGDWTVVADVSGLRGPGLRLRAQWTRPGESPESMTWFIDADGSYVVVEPMPEGTVYSFAVVGHPAAPAQVCTVSPSEGTLTGNERVKVRCVDDTSEFPYRRWYMSRGYEDDPDYRLLAQSPDYPAWSQAGAGLHTVEAGPVWEDFDDQDDDVATGEVYSGNRGKTFWVTAEGPHLPSAKDDDADELIANYEHRQSYRKISAESRIQLNITRLLLRVHDDVSGLNTDPLDAPIFTQATLNASIYSGIAGDATALAVGGKSVSNVLAGRHSDWEAFGYQYDHQVNSQTLNLRGFFDYIVDVDDDGEKNDAVVALIHPVTVDLDISAIPVGKEFTVAISATAIARDAPRAEQSYAGAHLRDPVQTTAVAPVSEKSGLADEDEGDDLGLRILATDLEPTNRPFLGEAAPPDLPAPTCGADTGSGGTLQFSNDSYSTPERTRSAQPILVTRTGGSAGVVDVRVRTLTATAKAGEDYVAIDRVLRWGDGDDFPRLVDLHLVSDDEVEPNEAVLLELSNPRGCAVLGDITTAELSILNDDRPPPETHTIAGTISGLTGSGLVLSNGPDSLPIVQGSTSFQFPTALEAGHQYNVRVATQPVNPAQICTVIGGTGTIGSTDVTTVSVSCTDAPPVPIELDATFGEGGKTFVPRQLLGPVFAMGRQSDGGIIVATRSQVARFTAAGALDTSFGDQGFAQLVLGGSDTDSLYDIAIQPDDRIVVAGGSRANANARDDFVIMRLNPDGSPDTGFGTSGRVLTDFGNGNFDIAMAVVVQSSGRIVAAGFTTLADGMRDVALAGYLSNGDLDPSFGTAGLVTTDTWIPGNFNTPKLSLSDTATAMTLYGDSLLVAGMSGPDRILLASYLPDGQLNPSFHGAHEECGIPQDDQSHSGWNHLYTGSREHVVAVAEQLGDIPEHQRILVGDYRWEGGTPSFTVVAARPSGAKDTPCGPGGPEYPGFGNVGDALGVASAFREGDVVEGMALQDAATAVLVGVSGGDIATGADDDFAIARIRLVQNFPKERPGVVRDTLLVDFFGGHDWAKAVLVQPDGKLVVAGTATNGTATGIGLVRLTP